VLAARTFSPNDFGAFVLAIAAVSVIGTLLDVTLTGGIVHHGFRFLADGDTHGLRRLLRAALVLDGAVGIAVTALMIGLAHPIAELAGGGELTATMIQIAAVTILASTLDGSTAAVLTLADRPQIASYCLAATSLYRLIGIAAVVHLGSAEALLAAYAGATAVGSATQAAVAWRTARREWPAADAVKPSSGRVGVVKKLMPFAIHGSVATTTLGMVNSLILVFLGQLSGTAAVAMFKVASLPVTVSALAVGPARMAMLPKQARLYAHRKVTELERDMRWWTKVNSLIAVPGVVAGFFLLPVILPAIYGPEYASAVDAARIILLYAFLQFAFPWTKNFAAVIGRPRVQSTLAGLMFAVAVTTILVVRDHGASAAAAGLSAGALAMTMGYVLVARRYFAKLRRGSNRFTLPGGLRAPGQVRARLRRVLAGRVGTDDLATIQLLASEIVTNAVRHGDVEEDGAVHVALTVVGERVRVEVRDSGRQGQPVGREPDLEAGKGFGLHLVNELAARWSADRTPELCVWFELDCTPAATTTANLANGRPLRRALPSRRRVPVVQQVAFQVDG
jgi:O-antigen/teichoic acid export membrane protein/anti-sigma regulatory factor (Ser/Thr protein kinase)